MAVTKTFRAPSSGNIHGSRYMTLKLEETNVSTENNTSDIKWTLTVSGDSTYYDTGVQIIINGTQVYHSEVLWSGGFPAKQGSTSGTLPGIAHNSSDGTKSISVVFKAYVYAYSYKDYGGTMELTAIPRASQIGVTDANIGSTSTITINKMSSSFTTSLYYRIKGASSWTTIVSKTANPSYAFTVPTSLYSSIPNAKTIVCEFKAETYSGSTLVGTSNVVSATFTATGNPVINSTSAVDTNTTTTSLTGNSSKIVKYASNMKVTVTTTPQNSSTIKTITINGTAATLSTSNGVTTGVVTISGPTTSTYSVVVTDSRGYTASKSVTIASSNFINYVPLTIANYAVVRNTPTDGKVNISVNGNYYNGSFGSVSNTLTIQYRYREKNGTWGSWTTISNSNYTYTASIQLTGFNYQKQYDFELKVVDKVNTLTITGIVLSKGIPIVNWEDSFFNVNGELRRNNQNILLSLYPVGSIYMSTNSTNPKDIFGGTWEQIKDRFLLACGSTYSNGSTGGSASLAAHTHSIPSLSGSTNTTGEHSHVVTDRTTSYGSGSQSSWRCLSWSGTKHDYWDTVSTWGSGNHSHSVTTNASTSGSTGSGNAGNMPPYLAVYVWKRTA